MVPKKLGGTGAEKHAVKIIKHDKEISFLSNCENELLKFTQKYVLMPATI